MTADHTPERLSSARLREVAEAATPGPWAQGMAGDKLLPEVDNRFRFGMVVLEEAGTDDGDGGVSTAAFIATFDPPTVLALLDSLAALRAECDVLRGQTVRVEALGDLCRDNAHATGSGPLATLWMSLANSLDRALHPQDVDQERTSR